MESRELRHLAQRMLADADAKPGPFAPWGPDLTIPQAYELQNEIARLREQRGESIIGYKVGCTSKAIQEQLGVPEPIFGRIFDTGCFRSGVRLSCARCANLAIEGELAVRLSRDLPEGSPGEDECLEAIEAVFPIIELHCYVLHRVWSPCAELIARNGMHAGVVVAEQETRCWGPATAVDSLSIRINETVVEAVRNPESMPSPVASLRWLAERLAEFGLRLAKGQLILTGSPMKLYPVTSSSKIVVEAPPLGTSWAEIGP